MGLWTGEGEITDVQGKVRGRRWFCQIGKTEFSFFAKFRGSQNSAEHERRASLAIWRQGGGQGGAQPGGPVEEHGSQTPRGAWLGCSHCVSITGLHPAARGELSLGESQEGPGDVFERKRHGDERSRGLGR